MFKKVTISALLICAAISTQAQEKATSENKMIKRGFFLNVGLAFPSATFIPIASATLSTGTDPVPSFTQSFGVQPNIEIGNQWYFWKNNKMGVGLRVSWFQFGYSSFSVDNINFTQNNGNIDLRFIKLAPQFTYALSDKMAFDFSFEISPTFMFGTSTYESKIAGGTFAGSAYTAAGLLFAPGVKFRYNVFAAGVDFGFGGLPFASVGGSADNSGTANTNVSTSVIAGTASIFNPRIYLGFKF